MPSTRSTIITILSVFAAVVLLFIANGAKSEYLPAFFMICTTGTVILWALSGVVSNRPVWYSPHVSVLVSLFMIEAAAPYAVAFFDVESQVYDRPLLPDEMLVASTVSLVGVLCYLLGWKLGPKRVTFSRPIERLLQDTPQVMGYFTPVVLFFVAISFLAWILLFGSVGGMGAYFQNIGENRSEVKGIGGYVWHIARFGMAGLLLYFARYNWRSPLGLVLIGVYTLFLFVYGERSLVAIFLLGLLIVYRMRWGFIPKSAWVIGAAGMFFLATFWQLLRATRGSFSMATQIYKEQTSSFEGAVLRIVGDFTFIIQRAELINYLRETGEYQYGWLYLALLKIIPGFLWPGQYELLYAGNIFYVDRLRPEVAGKVSLSSNFFTELYINFAFPGVLVGAFLFGIVMRWIHSRLIENPMRGRQMASCAITGLLFMFMLTFVKSGMQVLLNLFYLLLPIALIYFPNLGGADAPQTRYPYTNAQTR